MTKEISLPMFIPEIQELIPHRYPFLLVDRIVEYESGKRIVGEKNVSFNEPFFQGHFPGRPIMPGVLLLEALAQVGSVFAKLSAPEGERERLAVFSGLESVRFRRQVVPGDKLRLEMTFDKAKLGLWRMKGRASVEGEVAAEGTILAKNI